MSTATAEQSTGDAPVLVYNRKPQLIGFPKPRSLQPVDGIKDLTAPEMIKCQPGFTLSSLSEIAAAAIDSDRLNPHLGNGTITLVWWAPGDPPSDAYVRMVDLGREDTKRAIAGTGDVRILDVLAQRHPDAFVREAAHKRAESIRAGKPTLVGQPLAQDDGGDIDLGTF